MSKKSQAGKGDKYRTFSTEQFADNYDAIDWGHPKRKKHNGQQDSNTDDGKSNPQRAKPGNVDEAKSVE